GDFLAAYPPVRERPHVADLARLEWAIDESSRAADSARAPEAVLRMLTAIEPDRLPDVRLRLDPSCRLVESRFPILRIWKQPEGHEDAYLAPAEDPDRIVVRRESEGVLLEPVAAGLYAWLAALAAGETLAVAIDRAQAADAGFDLGAARHACIGNGTIAAIVYARSPRSREAAES